MQTDVQGKVQPSYSFSGSKGHAIVRALWSQKDTLDLFLRANTLVWGDSAQGQYVRIGDTYSFVKAFNGQPERVDTDPNDWFTYAVYESQLGVVVMLNDIDQDGGASNFETVHEIFVNSVYSETFSNGIGIGSDSSALVTAFGATDTTYFDPTFPPAWVYGYRTEGLTFWLNQATQPIVFEIHLAAANLSQPSPRRFGLPVMSK
jgi:hypothetical protein